MKRLARLALWTGGALLLLVALLAAPIAMVETACRADFVADDYRPIIADAAWQRPESRTFLTYPEWQMVFAYEEFASVLDKGDEHDFGYFKSLAAFWSSYCTLNRLADAHGGADFSTRSMIYTIGTSFNLEFGLKSFYEDTIGYLVTLVRGPEKTPQDLVAARMARDYGAFLHQTPWYRYPFAAEVDRLWQEPMGESWRAEIRGWERRLALGGEWSAKQAYAGLIDSAVAATGRDELRMRSVVSGLSAETLRAIAGIDVVAEEAEGVTIETNRYGEFSALLRAIAAAGGNVEEIAGNDDIMVSLLRKETAAPWPSELGEVVARIDRQGTDAPRSLVVVKVRRLADLIRRAPDLSAEVEHVYDY